MVVLCACVWVQGTPRSMPLSASSICVSTDQMRDAVLEQPGVGSATVRVQERRGKRSFVAYVTPSSIHGQTLKESMVASCVHGYCIPDVVIPVADLPNTSKGLEYHILNKQPPDEPFSSSFPEAHADLEQEGEQEEQEEVESPIGIIGKQSFQLSSAEQKVRKTNVLPGVGWVASESGPLEVQGSRSRFALERHGVFGGVLCPRETAVPPSSDA
jgi:hypothetical protein